jgi:HTH-type transcriptional regulator/antitoxin HigA
MPIRPVKTDNDYRKALLRIEELMDANSDTAAGEELDVLTTLVEVYERAHFPIDAPDPVAAILFRMEQMGLDRKSLEPFLGGRSRVSEVLNRKRSLSMNQIRKLHKGLDIPLENLIGTR